VRCEKSVNFRAARRLRKVGGTRFIQPEMSDLPAKPEPDGLAQKIVEAILGSIARIPTTQQTESPMPAENARSIAHHAALKAAAASGTLGLPVGPLGWLTIFPEMMKVWQIQTQMVADLAGVYGQTACLSREQMTYCLFRHGAAMAVRDLVVRMGERYLVKRVSLQAFQAIAKKVGITVSQRALGKALSRWVPVIGAVGMAGYAYFDTAQVAKTAIDLFERGLDIDLPEIEKLTGPSTRSGIIAAWHAGDMSQGEARVALLELGLPPDEVDDAMAIHLDG
jgi:hypothetical protein